MTKAASALKIAAVASAATSALFQITLVIGDGWIRQHLQPYVWAAWVICAALWICWGLIKQREVSSYPDTSHSYAPSASVNAPITVAPVFNIGNIGNSAPQETPKITASKEPISIVPETNSTPIFEVRYEWVNLVYELSPGYWRIAQSFDQEVKRSLIAWFTNPLPGKGQKIVSNSILYAHLRLKSYTSNVIVQIPSSYWIGQMGYQVNLGSGHTEGVILGSVEWQDFAAYTNHYAHAGPHHSFDVPFREKGEKKIVHTSDRFTIDVSLVDIQSACVVEHRRVDVSPTTSGLRAVEIQ